MTFFKVDVETILSDSQIEIVSDRGDGEIVIQARGGDFIASYADTIAGFNAKSPLLQISTSQNVPIAAVASVLALPGGGAQIVTLSGRVIQASFTFAAISTALAPLSP